MTADPFDFAAPPGEWIRIFACRLAQRRPDLSAADIVACAIQEFSRSNALPPEEAAARPATG